MEMKGKYMPGLSRTLPRFKMFTEFLADLQGPFEPVLLSNGEKAVYLKSLAALNGHPKEEFLTLREDLDLTARVREVRRYADKRVFVRYEFRRLESNCTWSSPYQMMALFNSDGQVECYTMLQGRGDAADGFDFAISSSWFKWSDVVETCAIEVAIERLEYYPECEVAVRDIKSGNHIAYVYGRNGLYHVEWYICCAPWIMTVGELSLRQVEDLFKIIEKDGVKGLEGAMDWRQFDFASSYSKYGVMVNVDANLRRSLELAKRRGDEMQVRTLQALGIGEGPIAEPYSIRVKPGRLSDEKRAVFDMAVEEEDKVKSSKLFAMLAMRGGKESSGNLGYHFHFGMGVPVDYELAVYWHTIAANAGDMYAMTNLGKIFSEKDGPVWDGEKAIRWFEKAAAKGETWAMGELGNCLLCGACAGRDAPRALSLLEKAVAANPDREDFVRNLERARMEA